MILYCVRCQQEFDSEDESNDRCPKCLMYKLRAEKAKQTCLMKYGVTNPMYRREFVDKIKDTMIERYGVNSSMQVSEFKEKVKQTNLKRYGVPYYVQTEDAISKQGNKLSQINKHFADKLIDAGVEIEFEKAIESKSFDLWIKDTSVLIELNPSYTHSTVADHFGSSTSSDYHLGKTQLAQKHGFRCIHVFDWDDDNKIIEMLSPKQTVFARKCSIKEVDTKECNEFLNRYHLQNTCKGQQIRAGLYLNDELIQLMTFGKPRYAKKYQWELLRLCTKHRYKVVGGAEKLYKYCCSNYNLTNIISYCDISKFTGDVYTRLGMKCVRISEPQAVWSKGINKITASLLRQRGYDQIFGTSYGKGTDNNQLMINNGWLPVFDCGQLVFEGNRTDEVAIAKDTAEDVAAKVDYSKYIKPHKSKEKTCEFCGELFTPSSNFQRYCKREHYMNCPVCNKKYLVTNTDNLKRPPVACSYECRVARTKKTCLEKYGSTAPGNAPEVVEKIQAAWKRRLDSYDAKTAEIKILEYTKPEVHTRIDDADLQLFKLKDSVAADWLKQYYPKRVVGTAAAFGLVKDNTIYQIMTLNSTRNCAVKGEIGLMFTLPGYEVNQGYSKLFRFITEDYDVSKVIAHVDKIYEDIEDYLKLGFVIKGESEFRYFWKDGDVMRSQCWADNHKAEAAKLERWRNNGHYIAEYTKI